MDVSNSRISETVELMFSIIVVLLFFGIIVASSALTVSPLPLRVSAQTTPPPIWPTLQHDFGRSSAGIYPGPSANTTDWIFGPTGAIQSTPVVGSDGTIYFVDSNFHLFAVNPDGSIRWEKTFNEGLFAPSISPSGIIYVPGVRHLFAFYPNGNSPWTAPYNLSTSRNTALAISPQGLLFEIDTNGTLHAINPFGSVATSVWSLSTSCLPASLALGPSGSLYCGTNSNSTGFALKAISSNGQVQWSFPTTSIVQVAPAISSDGTIFVVSSGGEIFAVSSAGQVDWTLRNIHQEVTSAVIGPSGTIYVAGSMTSSSGNVEQVVTQISQLGATEMWTEFCYLESNSLCFPFGTVNGMSVDSNGILYVATNSSGLVALKSDGSLAFAYRNIPSGEGRLSPIAIGSNGTLYVGTGCLYCNTTAYGHLLAIGQPSGYYSYNIAEAGLPVGNSWSFIVNGRNYSTTGSFLDFSLPNGSYSWTSPASRVPNTIGVRYAASVLQGSFSLPGNNSVSLSFSVEYQLNLTATPSVAGQVSPLTGQWYTPGFSVRLNASSFSGYNFGIWSETYGLVTIPNSTSPQTSLLVNGPATISGIFDPLLTIRASAYGTVQYLDPPYVGSLQPGQSVSFYAPSESVAVLTAKPMSGYSFQGWQTNSNLPIDTSSSVLQFKIASPAVLTANFVTTSVLTTASTSSSSQTVSSGSVTATTSSIVQVVSVPSTSVLPTRNVALDVAGAIIIGLAIAFGAIVILGVGGIRKKSV
jgi:hypothetical protein